MNVDLFKLFWSFFRISLFTVGGGPVMLAVMDNEFRERTKLFTQEDMNQLLAVVYAMPGAIGINSALYIGSKLYGIGGAVFSVLGVLIPPVTIILFITRFIFMIKDSVFTNYAFINIRAATSVYIIFTVIKLMKRTFRCWKDIVIAASAFVSVCFLGFSAVYVMAGAAVLGIVLYRRGDKK